MNKFGCCLLILCTTLAVAAQDQPSQADYEIYNLFDVSLEDLLDVSMISASQKDQSVLDAPANAYIVTAEQIRTRGYSNLVELLEDVPQIEIQRNSNPELRNVITVRGVSGNEKLLILQDGVRITPATDDYFILGNQFSILHAERVEVIIGPASALYGADAFAGIVNIITKSRTSDNSYATATSLGGNFSTQEHSFLAGATNGNTSFTISGLYNRSDEPDYQNIYPKTFAWYNNYYRTNNMVVESPTYSQVWNKLEWQRWADDSFTGPELSNEFDMSSKSYFINAEAKLEDFYVGYLHHTERHSTAFGVDPQYTSYDGAAQIEMSQDVIYAQHAYTSFDKRLNLLTKLNYNFQEIDPESHYAGSLSNWQRGYFYGYSKAFRIEEQAQYQVTDKFTLTSGASYETIISLPRTGFMTEPISTSEALDDQTLNTVGAAGYDTYLDPTETPEQNDSLIVNQEFFLNRYYNIGAFTQAQWTPSKRFEATIGTRFDYNSRYGTTINPRIGLVWRPVKSFILKTLYGRAFLAPSPAKVYTQAGTLDVFGTDQDGNILVDYLHYPNPDLKPEILNTLELSFNWFIGNSFSFSGNFFTTNIRDAIDVYAKAQPDESLRYIAIDAEQAKNIGTINIGGATFVLNHLWKPGRFQVNSSLSYSFIDGNTDFEDSQSTSDQLFYQAKNTIKATLGATTRRLGVSIRMISRSETFASRRDIPAGQYENFDGYEGQYYSNDAYIQVNTSGYFKVIDKKSIALSLTVKVYNALNEKYYNVYIGGNEGLPKTPQDPIRFNTGLLVDLK